MPKKSPTNQFNSEKHEHQSSSDKQKPGLHLKLNINKRCVQIFLVYGKFFQTIQSKVKMKSTPDYKKVESVTHANCTDVFVCRAKQSFYLQWRLATMFNMGFQNPFMWEVINNNFQVRTLPIASLNKHIIK